MKRFVVVLCFAVLGLTVAACGGGGSGGAGGSYGSNFALPASVSNFTETGGGAVNFQTTLSIEESVEFYRGAFSKAGLAERTINTAITDTTFSMIFDGDPSGKAIVVQGVDLGNGATNINIRYEDV